MPVCSLTSAPNEIELIENVPMGKLSLQYVISSLAYSGLFPHLGRVSSVTDDWCKETKHEHFISPVVVSCMHRKYKQ